jgi:hypothetical protein
MLDSLNQWANLNSDTAYLVGFSIIVGIFYGLFPYKVGLNVATSTGIPFKVINVWGQIKKSHRLGLRLGAVAVFALAHLGLGSSAAGADHRRPAHCCPRGYRLSSNAAG